jgi:hypothetical protein
MPKGKITISKKGISPDLSNVLKKLKEAGPRKDPLPPGKVQYGTALEFDKRQREWHQARKREVVADLKRMQKGADFVMKYVSSKESGGVRNSDKYQELKRSWTDYRNMMNQEASSRLSELKRVFAKIPDEDMSKEDKKAYLDRYIKTFKEHLLDDSREQEFYFYLMSNQLEKFNPKDYVSGMFKGDISFQDDQGEIQLKKPGGYFRLNYKALKVPEKELKSGKAGLITNLNQAILYSNALSKQLLAEIGSAKTKYTTEDKQKAMKKYLETSAAHFFILGSQASDGGTNFDTLIPKSAMVRFVEVAAKAFSLEKADGAVRLKWNGFSTAKQAFDVARVLTDVQIHSYDELMFYKIKGTTQKAGIMSLGQSLDYRRLNIEKGSIATQVTPGKGGRYHIFTGGDASLFIKIHSTFYGGIHYIKQYKDI